MAPARRALDWLSSGDPAIRWQAMRDLGNASTDVVAAERARVASEGWGARVLAMQQPDGTWGGVAWNRGFDSTMHALMLLREFGLDPGSGEARRAVSLVNQHVTWSGCGPQECADHGFFEGETEPCINAQVAAVGAYFGQDVDALVARLLTEQLEDGGWNCEAEYGSTRSSFHTTICVVEALLEYERSKAASPAVVEARQCGEEYLLERRLMRRRSTGEQICDRKASIPWTSMMHPSWWHYDVLRGLDHLRNAGRKFDDRIREALDCVASKRDSNGRWPLGARLEGRMPVDFDEAPGSPSRWNTLRAARVLAWATS
ncbi:MAG: hypothetical protein KDC95_05090 [Planctomycetes bacterium]|nr:hypothetical protein [Planctomycetota bacterium]